MTRSRKRQLTTRAKRCSGTSGSWSKRYTASRVPSLVFLDSACVRPRNYVSADDTIIEKLLQNHKCSEKCDKTQEKSVSDQIEGLRSNNSLDCLTSTAKSSTKDRPRISKTLLKSFLASVLWLKKKETRLSKSVDGERGEKPSISDSTVRMICDICELLLASPDSASEDGWSETEEQGLDSKTSCKGSISAESNDSDSAFDEAYATPPPSPPSSSFQLNPTPGVTRRDEEAKVNGSAAPVAVILTEEMKSTVRNNGCIKAVATNEMSTRVGEELEKHPKTTELTIAANTTAGAFDATVSKHGELQSYSSDSLDNVIDFDSDDLTSSLSGGDEMEEFGLTNAATLKSDSKAMEPRPRGNNPPMMETFKTLKPTFFEVWKYYPKLFMQEVVSRTAKMKLEENWGMKKQDNAQVVALVPGQKQEQEVVLENNNLDLVIYIQVEVEDHDKKEQLVFDFETNSFGTQTPNHTNEFPTLKETPVGEKHLHNIWGQCESQEIGKKPEESVTITKVHDSAARNVASADEAKPVKTENAVAVEVTIKERILTANVYLEQLGLCARYQIERPKPFYRAERNVELEKALELIREIENDVIDTKLSDAILILPRLESELRKHFKEKVKSLGDSEFSKSFDTFFSAFDIWPVEVANKTESEGSGERLYSLLALLSDLEKAVKASECSTEVELCEYDSSKIYGLLHALTENIRELEDCSNVTSLSQTLDIASKVDTAIREFENIVKRTPTDYVTPKSKKHTKRLKSRNSGEIPQHLKNVRKRVFQMVEEEAIDTEARLEKDSDKLERLERQNNEAMKFVEAFLEKTQRRANELANARTELKELAASIASMYEEIVKATNLRKNTSQEEKPKEKSELNTSSSDVILEEPVKETVSGLLIALDNLKSKARQKNKLCREILSSVSIEKEIKKQELLTRFSRSSFTAKNVEELYSSVRDFRKIGDQNLYLSWAMPEGPLADSLVGYEIFVNGKLNQKVRNPKRLQAILYSIDLSQMAEVLLYGLLENGFKIFLASVTYKTS